MIGRALSRQRLKAVASATFNPRASASSKVSWSIANRVGVLLRVVVVDTVDALGHQHDLGRDLKCPLRGGGVGGEVRRAETGTEDDDPALLEVPDRSARYVRLGDLAHRDGGLNARLDPALLEEVLERQAVHDRAEHAHVVSPRTIHPPLRELGSAEVVAAADDDGDLGAGGNDVGDLPGNGGYHVGVDTEPTVTGKGLTRELEQDASEAALRRSARCRGLPRS